MNARAVEAANDMPKIMKDRTLAAVWSIAVFAAVSPAGAPGAAFPEASSPAPAFSAGPDASGCRGPLYWQNEINLFLRSDAAAFPPPSSVLFMGSSSIRLWDLKKYFPGLSAINRGFGGSCLAESTYYADRIAFPYRPRLIVFYAGENDIAALRTPEAVVSDLADFLAASASGLPGVPVLYISMKPSPARWHLWPRMREANSAMEAACGAAAGCRYVDAASAMLGADGRPRTELFRPEDGLHMSDAGYRLWTDIISPLLASY